MVYAAYILSERSHGEWDGAYYFICSFRNLREEFKGFSEEARVTILSAIRYVLENEDVFDEGGVIDEGQRREVEGML